MPRLLYYSPNSYGGLADYAHYQANALVAEGVDVHMLSTPAYPSGRGERYEIHRLLKESPQYKNKAISQLAYAHAILRNISVLQNTIRNQRSRHVLLGSYAEYLAPIWSRKLRRLRNEGVQFGAVVHDPVRDFVVGPKWWHRWSIACGYSFLNDAFLHDVIELDTVRPMPCLAKTVIPFGPYTFPPPSEKREVFREHFSIPADAKLLLSFGHIRDGKNLDLIIRALVQFPELYMIVAGKEQSNSQKPASYYQQLAEELGVADRCRWSVGFVPEAEIGSYFAACDLVLLNYSRDFRSASSVLSAAAHYSKPCLASAGEGNLRSVVQKYGLGVWAEPDSLSSLIQGLRQFLKEPQYPLWEAYRSQNSWQRNASLVLGRLGIETDSAHRLNKPRSRSETRMPSERMEKTVP